VSAPAPATRSPAGSVRFSDGQLAEVRRLQALYPERQAALLPVLRMAQEAFGYVSPEIEVYVAELFEMSPAHVHEVVTFYTLFFQRPVGRHVISVCHNLSCSLRGAEDIVAHLEERLGIEAGETTADGRVTLLRVECLCACEAAPMMQVDEQYVGPLDPAGVDRVLEGLR
jgi:NADH-quinone oxidoreductase subunit E